MRIITSILLIFQVFTIALASYRPTRLVTLIHTADLIVEGSIEQVEEEYFMLKVKSVIKGKVTLAVIPIKKFESWACAQRFASYAKGQQLLVFLKQRPQGFSLIGKGDEGEMPVTGKAVYYKVSETDFAAGSHTYHPYGGRLRGYKYQLEDIKQVIAYLLQEQGSTTLPEPNRNPVMKRVKQERKGEMVLAKQPH